MRKILTLFVLSLLLVLNNVSFANLNSNHYQKNNVGVNYKNNWDVKRCDASDGVFVCIIDTSPVPLQWKSTNYTGNMFFYTTSFHSIKPGVFHTNLTVDELINLGEVHFKNVETTIPGHKKFRFYDKDKAEKKEDRFATVDFVAVGVTDPKVTGFGTFSLLK